MTRPDHDGKRAGGGPSARAKEVVRRLRRAICGDSPWPYDTLPCSIEALEQLFDAAQSEGFAAASTPAAKEVEGIAASLRRAAVAYQDEWPPGALEVLLLAAKEVDAMRCPGFALPLPASAPAELPPDGQESEK